MAQRDLPPQRRSAALPGVRSSTVLHGSSDLALAAMNCPSRASGNSSGLGKAEPKGTTLRDMLASRMSNTWSLTSSDLDPPAGREVRVDSGGASRRPPPVT
ncbi:hypothetical protein [Variovorax atrisoli]|uniref:hypothetical protein n=1 Tax=Variovorax atrisoli TaxID=3394203 RepID=UPI003F877ABA